MRVYTEIHIKISFYSLNIHDHNIQFRVTKKETQQYPSLNYSILYSKYFGYKFLTRIIFACKPIRIKSKISNLLGSKIKTLYNNFKNYNKKDFNTIL
jgi:hypothetical protein